MMRQFGAWAYRFWVLVFLMVIGDHCYSKDEAKLTKTITKGYNVKVGSKLELHNKYGDVIIDTWSKDSMVIAITITAFGKNDEATERLMKRTDIQFNSVVNGVVVFTQLDKSNGWLRNFWNELSGYSQTIISKDQLTIDYHVYLPEYMNLELNNKYGDVYVAERSATTRIDVSNGNLKTEELKGEVDLNLRFCQADISSVQHGKISLKSAELNLETANNLMLQSSSSTIYLRSVDQLRLVSRTDKISITDVGSMEGRSSFSKIRLKNIEHGLDLETNYGTLTLEKVNSGFTEVLVRGKSTDIELTFEHMAYFNTKIIAKEGKFNLPEGHDLKQVYTDGTEKFIRSTGHLGVYKIAPGEVNIDAQGGKVRVNFAPFDAQSYKENNKITKQP